MPLFDGGAAVRLVFSALIGLSKWCRIFMVLLPTVM